MSVFALNRYSALDSQFKLVDPLEHTTAPFVSAQLDFLLKELGYDAKPDVALMCLKCAAESCSYRVHHEANPLLEKTETR